MKKHLLCTAILAVFTISSLGAQLLEKSNVGVIPFTYTDKRYAKNSKELRSIVVDVLSRRRYIHLLDRSKINVITKELHRQKNTDYLNSKTMNQGQAIGAEIIIVGELTNMEVVKVKAGIGKMSNMSPPGRGRAKASDIGDEDEKATTNKLMLTFTLQAFNVETGELIDNKRFKISAKDANHMALGGFYETESTGSQNSVINHASKQIEKEVEVWLDIVSPPKIRIAIVDEKDKKGNPVLVSIIGGNEAGLHVGSRLVLYELTKVKIGDKILTRQNDIADLKVIEFQGDFTQCKVLSGRDEIKKKWNSDGKNKHLKLLVDHSSKMPFGLPNKKLSNAQTHSLNIVTDCMDFTPQQRKEISSLIANIIKSGDGIDKAFEKMKHYYLNNNIPNDCLFAISCDNCKGTRYILYPILDLKQDKPENVPIATEAGRYGNIDVKKLFSNKLIYLNSTSTTVDLSKLEGLKRGRSYDLYIEHTFKDSTLVTYLKVDNSLHVKLNKMISGYVIDRTKGETVNSKIYYLYNGHKRYISPKTFTIHTLSREEKERLKKAVMGYRKIYPEKADNEVINAMVEMLEAAYGAVLYSDMEAWYNANLKN